ncbi:MAG: T9SS type A sorting domain-containing protein [Flavisolibacter sp.]
MKRIIIFFLFLPYLGSAQNSHQSERGAGVSTYTVCNPDSSGIFQAMFNEVNLTYGLYKTDRCFYYYNSNSKHSTGFSQYCTMDPVDTVWNNSLKWINAYDINYNIIDSVTLYWSGISWGDSINRTQYAYDPNQNLISETKKGKNNNVWANDIRTIYTYNATNLTSSANYQSWDHVNNIWLNFDSIQYKYDSNNRLTNKYYYRVSSSPTVWDYYAFDTVHYNSLNSPTYLKKKWLINNFWTDQEEIFWTYDATNRILSKVYHEFIASSTLWENDIDSYYTYDTDERQILQSAGGYSYYSNCIAAGLQNKSKGFEFSIFPNPTNSTLSISSALNYKSIKIINSVSQMAVYFENKHELIQVSNLSNGIYFIQLLDKQGYVLGTQKFIKE